MKIALWGSYGLIQFPKGFNVSAESDIIESRKELAEFLQNNVNDKFVHEGYKEIEKELRKRIKESEHNCVICNFKENDTRYYVVGKNKCLGFWYIVDVDTSKLWLFDEYDGLESIRYYKLSKYNRLRKEES